MKRLIKFRLRGARYAVLSEPIERDEAEALTASEADVMTLLLEGLSNKEIAKKRGRAVRTIANQIASLFRKLGVNSRSELMALNASRN
ncbi:MAG: response regulator transcription factor [Archangium sp.]|nr:response regulator transcription factor [Archangium sp.]